MELAAKKLRRGMMRVAAAQVGVTLAVAASFLYLLGWFEAVSALYGGGIAVGMTAWLGRSVHRAGELAHADANGGRAALYVGAALRFVVAGALFALGLGVLRLAPVPIIVAFGLAQFGLLINLGRS